MFILEIRENLNDNRIESYEFNTFTTDFEPPLFNAFNIIFNKNKTIKQIGCYFHYINNIRKYLQSKGFTKDINKKKLDVVLYTIKDLPFLKLKGKDIEEYLKDNTKKFKTELEEFYLYFKSTWIKYFNNGVLWLNDINIKFRTNNCLESYNKQLKRSINNKKNCNIIIFIDNLIDEVINHEEELITENKKTIKMSF